MKCTRVAGRAFPDGKSLGRNRVISSVRQQGALDMATGDSQQFLVPNSWRKRYSRGWIVLLNVVGINIGLGFPVKLMRDVAEWVGDGTILAWACWGLAVIYIVLVAPFLCHSAARAIGRAVGMQDPDTKPCAAEDSEKG